MYFEFRYSIICAYFYNKFHNPKVLLLFHIKLKRPDNNVTLYYTLRRSKYFLYKNRGMFVQTHKECE